MFDWLPMDTRHNDGDDDDDLLNESANEELYVSDVSAELKPIIELVGNWIADEEAEPVQGHPDDLQALQEKLEKQEQLIHLLAKASSSLLHIYYKTKDEKTDESHPQQQQRLQEEMTQLTFRNSALLDQLRDLECQLADADHRVEDLIKDNRRLTEASSSMDASTQAKLKDLQKENNDLNCLISELVSQLKSRERHLVFEQQKTKKKMISLQESLESKDVEIAKVEKSKMALRKDIKGLNERLLAIEFEAEELKEELEKNRMKSDFYRFLLEKSELETAECREMLHEARQRLDGYNNRIVRTRLIRYVQNPNSPYVDPDSLACELDRVCHRERHRFNQATSEYGSTVDDAGSIPCDDISLSGVDCDVVDGYADEFCSANCSFQPPMGQPGQPGTYDLDMALDRLNLLQHWKRMFVRQMRPALTYTSHIEPRISRNLHFDCEFSMMTDSFANSSLRSTISFPMQIAFNKSFGGLNNIGRILHSGVLIRGCEAADVIEEVDYSSILDLEEDEDVSVKTDDVDLSHSSTDPFKSVAWNDSCLSERESGYSSSGRRDNRMNVVPTLKSKNAIGHFGGITCAALRPVQGTAMQRSTLGKMASKLVASNKQEKLPDCVIS